MAIGTSTTRPRIRTMYAMSETLFDEGIWLVGNATWSDLEEYDGNVYRLSLAVPLSLLMLTVRYCAERYLFAPVGRALSVSGARVKVESNPTLETAYASHKKPERWQIQGWAKQLDWSERQVERWLRQRVRQDKPTTLDKFCESAWRFTYYLSTFCLGVAVLWNEPWLWNIKECWRTYPYQVRPEGVFYYYLTSLTFYCSLSLSQFFDVKRKDFWQMFVHHIATITLLVFSWEVRLFRIGSLLLLVHESADILLEAAKITKYCGLKKTCEVVFGIFAISWVFSRMLIFPIWILKSTMFDILEYHEPYPGYYIFNFFLIVLYVLDNFWTYLLMKLIFKILTAGEMMDDIRSDSESSGD